LVIFVGIWIGCQSPSHESELAVFKSPQIINSQVNDSVELAVFQVEYVTEAFPVFAGKFKFLDKIDVNPENRDTALYKDFMTDFSPIRFNDSLDVNGFELVVDYEQSVKYNEYYRYGSGLYDYYPVYFVNSTKTDKIFLGKDSYVFGIQEALDKEGEYAQWRPIEGRGFDFCGNGRWKLIVHPQEFVLILMRKYKGDYETEMRVRFQVGENIFVSRPFKGRINEKQFSIHDSSYVARVLRETDGQAWAWLFYGAPPREEWVVKTF